MRARSMVAIVGLWCWVLGTSATACVVDGECDDGDVCTVPDTCVSGVCSSGGGGDTDADGTCNADDDTDAALSIVKARLRLDTSGQGDNSIIKLSGFFVTTPPSDVFDGGGGFTVRVRDSLGLDATATFLPADCVPTPTKTKCVSADKRLQASLRPIAATPEVVQFAFVLRRLGLEGALDGPVDVTITQTPTDRHGSISDCVLKLTGIACRQF